MWSFQKILLKDILHHHLVSFFFAPSCFLLGRMWTLCLELELLSWTEVETMY